ncbi:MAG: hypothetical protein ACYTGA_06340 [Planctomycetota bacterium]|jgi:hypothetical protein
MTKQQAKRVAWAMFVGSICQKLLHTLFCSSAWFKACVRKVVTQEGAVAEIDVNDYPPGGRRQTKMLHCQACQRWAPRNGYVQYEPQDDHIETRLCLDCVIQADAEAFSEYLEKLSEQDKSLAWELKRLSLQTIVVHDLIVKPEYEYSDTCDVYNPDSGELDSDYRWIKGDYWDAFKRHEEWVCKDTHSSEQRDNLLWEIDDANDECTFSRRSLGCQSVLLDEDQDRLWYEIDYYQKKKRVLPSTRRGHKVNPFKVKTDYLESAVPYSNDEFGFWDLD